MTPRELEVHRRTRDRQFLLFGALGIGMVFGVLGLAVGWWHGPGAGLRVVGRDGIQTFSVEEILGRGRDLGGLAETLRELTIDDERPPEGRRQRANELIVGANLPAGETARLHLLADGLLGDAPAQHQAIEALRRATAVGPPRRFDHEWLADILSRRQEFEEANTLFENEGRTFPDAERARNLAFQLALNRTDTERLRRLLDDAAMRIGVSPGELARAQALCGDYGALFVSTLRGQMVHWSSWLHVGIALVCGALWWLLFARIAGVPPARWWLALPALALGVVATTLTLAAQVLLPVSFAEDGNLLERARFFTIGVGLREETLKLLCTLPLIVLLRREQSANVVLVVLSTVGLGFAIEENTGYFAAGPSPAWARFLTANFLHLAWTGMLGYSLWRALRGVARGWEQFLATFLFVVLSHGAYDVCTGPVLGEDLSFLSILILVAVAFRYFGQLRSVAELSRQVVSPLAVFILGSAALLGLSFTGLCWALGVQWGTALFLSEALAVAPMAFLFIREFRDD